MFSKQAQVVKLKTFATNVFGSWISYDTERFIMIYKYKFKKFEQYEGKYFNVFLTYVYLEHAPENFSKFIVHLNELDVRSNAVQTFIKRVKSFRILFAREYKQIVDTGLTVDNICNMYMEGKISFFTFYFSIEYNDLDVPYGYRKLVFNSVKKIMGVFRFPQDAILATINSHKG